MAKTPATPNMPINHPNLSAGEEYSESALHQAETENEEFYESAYDFMTGNEVTLLQSGINEKVARALIRKRPALDRGAPPGTNYSRAVGEEKLTAALYRAVHGQKIHDTEHGQDDTNYELSVNRQHLDSPWHRRFGRQIARVARGAISAIGNNTVEADLVRRFGRNKDPIARRDYIVRQRLQQPLEDLETADPVLFEALAGILNLPAGSTVADVQDQMSAPDAPIPLSTLRFIMEQMQGDVAGVAFISTPAFRDFVLLVRLDQQHTADFGVSAVYDREPIREFFAALDVDLQNVILTSLDENEIYDLEHNEDGTALLSNIRGRFYELVVSEGMTQAEAMDEIRREIAEIRQQECLAAAQTPENAELINNINQHIQNLIGRHRNLTDSFNSLIRLSTDIGPATTRLNGLRREKTNLTQLQSQKQNLTQQQDKARKDLNDLKPNHQLEEKQKNYETQQRNLRQDLDKLTRANSARLTGLDRKQKDINDQISKIQARLHTLPGPDQDVARQQITDLLTLHSKIQTDIDQERTDFLSESQLLKDDINDLQVEIDKVVASIQRRLTREQNALNKNIAALQVQIDTVDVQISSLLSALGGPLDDLLTEAQSRLDRLINEQNTAVSAHINLETSYKDVARTLVEALSNIPNHPVIQAELIIARDVSLTAEVDLRGPVIGDFLDHIQNDAADLRIGLETTIPNNFLSLLTNRTRMPAFVLLQRMLRRDYFRRRNLAAFQADPNLYNAEANQQANVKAALRVEDVKSADRKRSANQRAAELIDRGIIGRGWDKVKGAVARGQNFVGLEPINFADITADKLLEQLVNSEEEFTVFKGINKYTTVRDLRHIINKSGREIRKETLERFSAVLEEAISRFKKVRPSMEKGLHADDWDLENLITVFKKLKVEMWSQEFMSQVEDSGEPGQRELNSVRMLRGSREQERNIQKTIERDVKNPDAIWRVYLAKADLKKVLDKDQLEAANEIRALKIKEKQSKITQKQAQLNSLPEGHADRAGLEAEINNLRNSIVTVEKQTRMANNLYERVEEAKEYIYSHKLSRKQRKEYLESVGLAQVFDKMSTNYKLQRTWHYTKKAAAATWRGTKGTWAWSRRKFLNKESAGKVYEVGRLLATPGVAIAKGVWTVGAFIPSLVGRGLLRTTQMPKRLVGTMNHNTLRSYYRERIANLVRKINKVKAKHRRLKEKLDKVQYSFTKQRIAKRMNELEHEGYKLMRQIVAYQKSAAERKVMLGDIAHYTEANAEPGSVEFESFK